MPLTISPPTGGLLGPGLGLFWSSDFIGPLPTGSHYLIEVFPQGSENHLAEETIPWLQTGPASWQWGIPTETKATYEPQVAVPNDTPINISVNLVDDKGVIQQGDTDQSAKYTDTTAWALTTRALLTQQTGLPAQVQQQIQDTWTWVQQAFTTLAGLGVSTPIGSLLSHPDRNLLHLSSGSFTLTGRGVLTGNAGTGMVGIYGLNWAVSDNPSGAGVAQGNILEWELRVVQWALQFHEQSTGVLLTPEVLSSSLDTFTWYWTNAFPNRILYDITPGFELTCQWLVLA